jgi:pantothenate synthetase
VRDEIHRAPLAEIDYAELRDPQSLEAAPETLDAPSLLALAVFLKSCGSSHPRPGGDAVRLIDNRVLDPGARPQSEVTPR